MPEPHRSHGSHSDASDPDPLGHDQSRATFESLVNTLPLSVLIKDRSGYRVFANEAYLNFRCNTAEELLGKRDEDLFPPDIAKQFTEDDRRVMENREVLRDVEETLDGSGRRCWIERIKSPIVDHDGHVIGLQLVFWDVTDRVRAERELERERDLLRNLLQRIPDSIYFKDRESRFLRISEAMAAKFRLPSADAAVGKTDADIFSSEHAEAARQDELDVMRTGEPVVGRVEKETWHDRDNTWCLTTKMPFLDDDGNVIGTFGISRDITELQKSQEELREARDVADRANRAKSDFLANMSHEIRTPMNAVIGMSELLAMTDLTDEQRDYVHLVRDSADSLLRLLNDILDFSKIEARKLELEEIPFSVRDLIEKTARTLSVRAAEKGLELACRVEPDVPDRLIGDPGRLRQIMINLIGNSVKFTDEGEIVVEVSLDERSDERSDEGCEEVPEGTSAIRFSVQDTGIGVPQDKQATVLEAFTQADTSTTRRFGGTGLGLAICRELVELMHGHLALDSEVGRGTTFHFTIPVAVAPSVEDQKSELKKLGHLPVLVVDDNATNRTILREILTTWQFKPSLAEGGRAALAKIQEAADRGETFALAILDCMMPEMDGFELAQRIRERYTDEETKLIILSSATHGDDIQRCREIGISRYMTKPVVQSELLDTVLQVMGMVPEPAATDEDELPVCPPMRVLVAEDGMANQHVVVGMLQAAGHQAVVASDGREAISRWQSEPFDLILMDMHMPVMDGIEATEQIRAEEADTGRHIPIIAVTAAALKADAEACQQAGMDDYVTKPIHPRLLQETMARHAPEQTVLSKAIESREAGTSFVVPGATSSSNRISDKVAGAQLLQKVDAIDLEAAAARVPSGLRGVRQLAEVFLPECQSLMKTLRAEIPDGDPVLVQRAAHTIKGSANLFYAKGVADVSLRLETIAKDKDLSASASELESLEVEVDKMVSALKHFLSVTSSE